MAGQGEVGPTIRLPAGGEIGRHRHRRAQAGQRPRSRRRAGYLQRLGPRRVGEDRHHSPPGGAISLGLLPQRRQPGEIRRAGEGRGRDRPPGKNRRGPGRAASLRDSLSHKAAQSANLSSMNLFIDLKKREIK